VPFFGNPVDATKLSKWNLSSVDPCFREWMKSVIVRAKSEKLEIIYEHNEQYETCLRKIATRVSTLNLPVPELSEEFEKPVNCLTQPNTVHNWFSVGGRTQLMIFAKGVDLKKYDGRTLADYAFEPVSIFSGAKFEIIVNSLTRRKSLHCDALGHRTVYSSMEVEAFSMLDGAPCVIDITNIVEPNKVETMQAKIIECHYAKSELVEGVIESEISDGATNFKLMIGQHFTHATLQNLVSEQGKSTPVEGGAKLEVNDWGGSLTFNRLYLPSWELKRGSESTSGVIDVDRLP
jgi:hypothetical protein